MTAVSDIEEENKIKDQFITSINFLVKVISLMIERKII